MDIIRITEEDLRNLVKESLCKILTEDGESAAIGGGSFNGATNAQISSDAMYDTPFGGVQRRKIYSKKKGDVDMSPTLKRHDGKYGSISIQK